MIVQKLITTTKDVQLDVEGITLLTVEEAKALPVEIRKCSDDWWLRSPGLIASRAACVYGGFGVVFGRGGFVDFTLFVRPALTISNPVSSNLQIGDKIKVFNYTWTVISEKYLLCDNTVRKSYFREDRNAPDANDYESSDLRKWIEKWYADQIALTESEGKE